LPDTDSGAARPGEAVVGTEAGAPRSARTASPDATAAPEVVGQWDRSTSIAGGVVVLNVLAPGVGACSDPAVVPRLVSTSAPAGRATAPVADPVARASVALSVAEPSPRGDDNATLVLAGASTCPESVGVSSREVARA
jgi:hypothetical protein